MASPSILREIADFLGQYPPFEYLPADALAQLASRATLRYLEQGEKLFLQGQAALPDFFVVKKGLVELRQRLPAGDTGLLDTCEQGDVFGIRAGMGQDAYLADAFIARDALIYSIPLKSFLPLAEQFPKVGLFLARGFAAGSSVVRHDLPEAGRNHQFHQFTPTDALDIQPKRAPVCCGPETRIVEAARLMTREHVGSLLIVDEQQRPLGILTDSDFRRKVGTEERPMYDLPVREIMSSPVCTVQPGLPVAALTQVMVARRITHLCVTRDGTVRSPVLAVISQRDIVTAQGNHPAFLVKQLLHATRIEDLARLRQQAEGLLQTYLDQDMGIEFVTQIITEINDALIRRAVELAQDDLAGRGCPAPALDWCWLSMGSEGRREQLLRTDQDNALVYQDPSPEQADEARQYFLLMAQSVTETLVACGFERCPGGIMASNPKWCMPLSAWKEQFSDWIRQPTTEALLHAAIFFDFRPTYGTEALARTLRQWIIADITQYDLFMALLAKNAVENPPPLSFFRHFIVEKTGEHKDHFDLKLRAMMPLTDAARLLAYEHRLQDICGTIERLEAVGQADPALRELCEAAALGYAQLLRLRAKEGLRSTSSGRYLHPDHLNKLEKHQLRSIFKTISLLQETLTIRYRVRQLG